MKISELLTILTSMVSMVDQEDTPTDTEPQDAELDVMVSPLQQELELLKKATGVDNVFDKTDDEELTIIKKNAGLPVQIQRGEN